MKELELERVNGLFWVVNAIHVVALNLDEEALHLGAADLRDLEEDLPGVDLCVGGHTLLVRLALFMPSLYDLAVDLEKVVTGLLPTEDGCTVDPNKTLLVIV